MKKIKKANKKAAKYYNCSKKYADYERVLAIKTSLHVAKLMHLCYKMSILRVRDLNSKLNENFLPDEYKNEDNFYDEKATKNFVSHIVLFALCF